MKTSEDLKQILERIDHRGIFRHIRIPEAHTSLEHIYWALIMYREIRLRHRPGCIYRWQEERPGFRGNLYDSKCKKMAVADYLLRNFAKQLERYSFQAHGSGKAGSSR